jgi:hypothetical protein
LCCCILFSAILPIAIGFSGEKPALAKAIINAEKPGKADIVVCWPMGVWRA